ncbi:hypothetical protein [Bacillus subtilis]|uniref:Uncharacterized protein n=1 Tax=Bacillus subtilis TaxID=1423 RepID=A0A8I1WIM0_BACIU|nr:hypothetical protein [Bacillus subtilis]MBO3796503.1 hypothetical protein [Bacillus subtilis]
MKAWKIKLIMGLVIFFILEYVVILLSGIAPFIAEKKTNMSADSLQGYFFDTSLHPFVAIQNYLDSDNRLFIVGSIAAVIVALMAMFNTKSNKKELELADSYGVHGSSRWATDKELFVEKQTVGVPPNQLMDDLIQSMKGENKDG